MPLQATVGSRTFEIVLGATPTVDGKPIAADIAELAPGVYSVLLDGRSYRAVVTPGTDGGPAQVALDGRPFEVALADERQQLLKRFGGGAGARKTGADLKAPMPGLVVRLAVAEGDRVEAGQPILILEAMKMENDLKAPASGIVRKIHVTERQAVEKGTLLVSLATE